MLVVVSFFDAALSSYNTAQFFIVSILLWRNGYYWYLYKRSMFILEWFWGLNCLHRYILKSEIWFEIWLITFGNTNCCQLWRFASVSGDISSGDWTVCWLTFFFFFELSRFLWKRLSGKYYRIHYTKKWSGKSFSFRVGSGWFWKGDAFSEHGRQPLFYRYLWELLISFS